MECFWHCRISCTSICIQRNYLTIGNQPRCQEHPKPEPSGRDQKYTVTLLLLVVVGKFCPGSSCTSTTTSSHVTVACCKAQEKNQLQQEHSSSQLSFVCPKSHGSDLNMFWAQSMKPEAHPFVIFYSFPKKCLNICYASSTFVLGWQFTKFSSTS